jgi:hypothetical protein
MLARWRYHRSVWECPRTHLHFAANAGVIDLLVWARSVRPTHSIRRDDCFLDFGTHVLKALGEDGSKIQLQQSECTMRDLSRAAAAHRIVPVG